MRLRLADVRPVRGPAVDVAVAAGGWERIGHPHPDDLLEVIAGTAAGGGAVLLDGSDLTKLPAHARAVAGLGSVAGRLPDIPAMRVVDVLLLARRNRIQGQAWRAALGGRRARELLADDEAAARSLAGRCGAAAWLDQPAVRLPDEVAALVDTLRAVGGRPQAVVWRRPEWLPPAAAVAAERALQAEQHRRGFAVLELCAAGGDGPGDGPVILEIRPR